MVRSIQINCVWCDIGVTVSNITEVFTVQQLKQKRSSMAQDIRATTQYGLMCVMLTSFNLDTDDPGILHKVWYDFKSDI